MDRLYKMVNQTISSPGEDVLYDMMRRPVFSQAEIDKRDELIDFFSQHEKEREHMQLLLSQIGKTRLGSLSDTVLALKSSSEVKTGIHWFMLILLVLNVAVLFTCEASSWLFLLHGLNDNKYYNLLCRQ